MCSEPGGHKGGPLCCPKVTPQHHAAVKKVVAARTANRKAQQRSTTLPLKLARWLRLNDGVGGTQPGTAICGAHRAGHFGRASTPKFSIHGLGLDASESYY